MYGIAYQDIYPRKTNPGIFILRTTLENYPKVTPYIYPKLTSSTGDKAALGKLVRGGSERNFIF